MDSQQQQQRQQRQHTLLEHAASHGPYLWSSKDIENALLWFPSASSAAAFAPSSSVVASAARREPIDDIRNDDVEKQDDAGCEFLRRLLHSPGIHIPRFAPNKSSSSQRGRKRETTERGDDFKMREKTTAGKKRKRERTDAGNSFVRGLGEEDILSTVLKGYYQLFMPRHAVVSSAEETDDTVDPKSRNDQNVSTDDDARARHSTEKTDTKTDDSIQAENASSRLQHDLNSIVLSRLRTHELYEASLHQYSKYNESNTLKRAPKELQMNILIDQYMTHPTTGILRAYTSGLFDRHKSLVRDNKDDSPFLRKIFGLTRGNDKIQQVVILFLLEPPRRLFVKKMEGWYCKKEDTVQSSHRPWHDAAEKQSTVEEMTTKISLFPLLTSSVSWTDIPQEEIEKECSRNPMPEIIDFILRSASSSTHQVNPNDGNERISWWTLPSPLMCVASQIYFPLAYAYIRHWIEAAIAAHDDLYNFDPAANNNVDKPQSQVLNVRNNTASFESAVLRIRQICQTSKRLESLFYSVLAHMENEAQGSFEDKTRMGHNDAEESTVVAEDVLFRQRLCWEAIRRAVENDYCD